MSSLYKYSKARINESRIKIYRQQQNKTYIYVVVVIGIKVVKNCTDDVMLIVRIEKLKPIKLIIDNH